MRILFVAMANSIHTSRWIHQLANQGWDIHLFPVEDFPPCVMPGSITLHDLMYHPIHKTLNRKALSDMAGGVKLQGIYWKHLQKFWDMPVSRRLALRVVRRLRPQWQDRVWRLAETIRTLKPDLIHSLETQHGSYLVQQAKVLYGANFPPWAISIWGSDLYLFGQFDEHQERVRNVLASCNYLFCDCNRDIEIAHRMGFSGEVMPVFPVAGGHDIPAMRRFRQPGKTSERSVIVLKGYQHWAGRALVGLRALELCADLLQGYRIVIFYALYEVKIAADLLSERIGVPISAFPYMALDEVLQLQGKARLSIGLSISDGISTSFLEAMIMGSFPIQSNPGCANEWADDGQGALFVPPEDPHKIAEAIRRVLTDDSLVDRGAAINDQTVETRLDLSVMQTQVVRVYEHIRAQIEQKQRV